jgi:hypothetical protein
MRYPTLEKGQLYQLTVRGGHSYAATYKGVDYRGLFEFDRPPGNRPSWVTVWIEPKNLVSAIPLQPRSPA